MMNNPEIFKPTKDWPELDGHDKRLHEKIQKWGEAVIPELRRGDEESRANKIAFFQFLMESVQRGDNQTAGLIHKLNAAMLESTRSYYTGQLGSLSKESEAEMIRYDFKTLYRIFLAGRNSV